MRERGVKCQSNHPLRGLTLNPPLAGKAGLGGQGKQGLLITPQYGVRQRIAPIFLEFPIFEFTDSHEHDWIEQYCDKCGICAKDCPVQAILPKSQIHLENVPGIGAIKTCIDIRKCFPEFASSFGCSICLKVCPFSKGQGSYDHIKKRFENNHGII